MTSPAIAALAVVAVVTAVAAGVVDIVGIGIVVSNGAVVIRRECFEDEVVVVLRNELQETVFRRVRHLQREIDATYQP